MGLGLLAVAQASSAALITLDAGRFSVSYDSDLAAAYGEGFLTGSLDTVYFQPIDNFALSGGAPASTPTSLQLTFTIDPGYDFAGLTFTERGDYFILGGGTVNVGADILAVNAGTAASVSLFLAPFLPLDQTGESVIWEINGGLTALGLGMPQVLQVTLDNALFASAPPGELSYIQKTFVGFRIATEARPAAVPEPSSWALVLAGALAALLVGGWRRGGRSAMRFKRND